MNGRKFWEEYTVIELYKEDRGRKLVVIVGADEPLLLEKKEANELAMKVAHKNGFHKANGKGEVQVHGQNALATREFYYER
jgi:hypothetical protein